MGHCAKISITFCPVWSGGRNAITADGRGISKGNVDVVAQCYSNNALMSKIWHHNKRKINLQSASRFVQLNFGTKLPREEGNFRLWNNRCFGPQLYAEGVGNCTKGEEIFENQLLWNVSFLTFCGKAKMCFRWKHVLETDNFFLKRILAITLSWLEQHIFSISIISSKQASLRIYN